ncbi:family 78 glycoside hydrolase catalytic domain [Mucilaginibacter mali]|uniref:alpha-L-rhamnosidase n=1 Tax=Mucilaginibacter mali TaxID=2740462 RepID=A0A7D4U9S9_9SPHI|nr:family 78 glycoside hydrolase catalytic domain [Mucilaginibacter mali]QKJ29338.1 family 78 glycoside hydrolase catalytic domain [Mucilaginibacter mali]
MRKLYVLLAALFLKSITAHAQTGVKWQAKWIEPADTTNGPERAAQYFRKTFKADQKPVSATLYITCHGLYEAQLNGKRVGDAYFTPGWTEYKKRLQYQQYDVTSLLTQGNNTINVTVGDGWYRGNFGFNAARDRYGKHLGLLCQLEVKYKNGKTAIFTTDNDWQSASGPIRMSEINAGETIDARVQPTNWSAVTTANYGYDLLLPTQGTLVTRHETFKPIKVITTPKGEKVLDFGQNLVGWVIVKARGTAGTKISIKHAEVLDKDGNFYTENLRAAKATATYILAGNGEETFEPHFTYFGFRYIQVDGYPGAINPDDFTAVALYSNMAPTGTFECSNPMINQLQHNIQWGQKGNFLDVPTDCPQRDERLGWTGDAQVFFRTAAYNYDVKRFFTKWMADVAVSQRADGAIPHVVPDILNGSGGSAGWADVATIIPWNMYLVYGDKALLATQYPTMVNWIGFMTKNSTNNLWNKGNHYGDWLSYHSPNDDGSDAITDKYEIAQCFYAYSTQLVINAAKVLGKTEDVARYQQLLNDIKAAYNKEYVTGGGRLMSNTQTAYVLALQFDMLPEDRRAQAAKYLVDNIKRYNNHLTTGFLGTPYLCHVLTRFGYTDVAYQLLLQPTYPGWLYPIKMGATTVWERWDGIKADGTFQSSRMNSFNHYAYGAIGDWMYRTIAGIDTDPDQPGYKHIIIKPHPGGDMTYCKASFKTQHGDIKVEWHNENGKFSMSVTVPENTTATISVPDNTGANYTVHEVKAGQYQY